MYSQMNASFFKYLIICDPCLKNFTQGFLIDFLVVNSSGKSLRIRITRGTFLKILNLSKHFNWGPGKLATNPVTLSLYGINIAQR